MRIILTGVLLISLYGCTTTTGGSSAADAASEAAQTQTTSRPASDIARDAGRQPFAVLDFLGVEPGMTVLDVLAAGGYYTEVLSTVVGAQGLVYTQNPAVMLRFGNGRNDRALTDRLLANRLANVRRLDREFDDLGIVPGTVDVALTALNFHDIYNNDPAAAQAVLQAIRAVLKPGGVLGVIDHVGIADADNAALHRIEPALVIAAAEAAGFSVEQSDLLANAQDDHLQNPFAPGMRGNTDRFVLKLTKPE